MPYSLQLMQRHEKEQEALSLKHKEEIERMEKEHGQVTPSSISLESECHSH